MSLYTKFFTTMQDFSRHEGIKGCDIVDMWSQLIRMIGENQFNSWLEPHVQDDYEMVSAENAFSNLVVSLRKLDNFEGFWRTKTIQVPHPNQDKFPGKFIANQVKEEDVSGHLDMLVQSFINFDSIGLFQKVFTHYFELYKSNPDVPTIEFVFEKNTGYGGKEYNGLIGVRVLGEEEFWTDEKVIQELQALSQLAHLTVRGIKHYRQAVGIETKPEGGPNYAAIDSPIHRNSHELQEIVSYEIVSKKPFKWVNSIEQPKKPEKDNSKEKQS